jgi:excisionase family DNA binding protein
MNASTVQSLAEEIFTSEEVKGLAADLIRLALKPEIKADALYNYDEVAVLADVSARTIKRAVESGRLKTDYVGGNPRIRGAAILQWLDEGGKTARSKKNLLEEAA